MDEKTKQALSIIEQLAIGALSNGMFKTFNDADLVKSAVEYLKQKLQEEKKVLPGE